MCEQNGFETVLNTGPRRDSNQGQAGRKEGKIRQTSTVKLQNLSRALRVDMQT